MRGLFSLFASFFATDLELAIARRKRNATLLGVVGVLVLSAWVIGLIGAIAWASKQYGLPVAALITSGFLMSAALSVLAVMSYLNRRDKKRTQDMREKSLTYAAMAASSPMGKQASILSLVLAAGIGLWAGSNVNKEPEE